MALSIVIGVVRLTGHHQGLLSEASLIPWLLALAAALLVLGFLTAVGCQNMTVAAAERERDAAEKAMRDRVAGVTRDQVLVPVGQEIAQYERFRQELAIAAAVLSPLPAPGPPADRALKAPAVLPRSPPGRRSPPSFPRRAAKPASLTYANDPDGACHLRHRPGWSLSPTPTTPIEEVVGVGDRSRVGSGEYPEAMSLASLTGR